jgi:hypothetical protein
MSRRRRPAVTVEVCTACGERHLTRYGHPACTGHRSAELVDGVRVLFEPGDQPPCKRSPGAGLTVCPSHGGGTANAKAKGEQRVAEQQIIDKARKLIPDVADRVQITNPLEKLLELASEADAFRESLRLMANELDRIRYTGLAGGEQLRAEVATYRAALRDTTDLLVAIARLDIDTRLAQHAVARDELYLKVLTAILRDLGHDVTEPAVAAKVERHLRAV